MLKHIFKYVFHLCLNTFLKADQLVFPQNSSAELKKKKKKKSITRFYLLSFLCASEFTLRLKN